MCHVFEIMSEFLYDLLLFCNEEMAKIEVSTMKLWK